MQLLAALDQIGEALELAIIVALAFVGLGMIVHATILLVKRIRSRSSKWAALRE